MKRTGVRILAFITLSLLLAILAVIALFNMMSFVFLLVFATIGIALFVMLDLRSRADEPLDQVCRVDDTKRRRRTSRVLSLSFFVLFALSILTLSPGSYAKPLEYYLLISLCAGVIAADIILVSNGLDISLNLTKSFLLALNVFLSNQLVFPYGIGGADSPTQLHGIVDPLMSTGHIPSGEFIYSTFPIHHILVAVGSAVSSVSSSMSYYCLGAIVLSFGVLVAFLVGRYLLDTKVGLTAALLFPGCSYVLYWASHPAQLTYALPLIAFVILIVLYLHRSRALGFKVIAPILILGIIFSHPYSSLLLFVLLFSVLAIEKVLALRGRIPEWSVGNILLIYLGTMLVHWIYYSMLFETAVNYAESYYLTIVGESLGAFPTIYDHYPPSEILLNTIGVGLVLMLSVCGFFYFLRRTSVSRLVVIGYAVTLIGLAFAGVFFRFAYLLPNRIFYYLEALALVFLFAGGVRYLGLDLLRRGRHVCRGLLFAGVVLLVFFFSTSSTIAGFETSLFAGDHPNVKLFETISERQSAHWMGEHVSIEDTNRIYTSWSFSRFSAALMYGQADPDHKNITYMPLTEDLEVDFESMKNNSAIVFSRFDIDFGFSAGQSIGGRYGQGMYVRLEEDVLWHLASFERCYDNGDVKVFLKP